MLAFYLTNNNFEWTKLTSGESSFHHLPRTVKTLAAPKYERLDLIEWAGDVRLDRFEFIGIYAYYVQPYMAIDLFTCLLSLGFGFLHILGAEAVVPGFGSHFQSSSLSCEKNSFLFNFLHTDGLFIHWDLSRG